MKKNIYKLFILCILSLSFTGCDEDLIVFDVDNGQTLVAFASASADLPIEINSTGSVSIPINSTTRSSSDRTIMISVDPSSTANPNAYSFNSQVVIPANEFTGTLVINGVDDMVETTPESLVLSLSGGDINGSNINISVFQVCPVPETFGVGNYMLTSTGNLLFGTDVLQPGSVFNVTASGLTRQFSSQDFAGFCAGTLNTFSLNLVCNEVLVPDTETTCNCADNNLFTNGSVNGTYDPNDDSVLTFSMIRNCGGSSVENTFTFTRQ
ncbi:hypothetical protein [Winogradskyella immobilis]|uniref:Calx-beta domain-containing protein n=1 Tax=Winogradskyella immobilis TaxID=2816852 RepID=A0ABS8ELY7_9FLAO|nr:hypothetical protein [Winogradskyella immobilis]MCC1483941.1 hypothetical protein [Winogradskyella immobilis]MCG0016034.1 hypothetical protein [Winogradskyella immobilis]